jgi:hypothetical protein
LGIADDTVKDVIVRFVYTAHEESYSVVALEETFDTLIVKATLWRKFDKERQS